MANLEEIEIVTVRDDGSGYAVFHLSDGTSIGQRFQQAPVTGLAEFKTFLTSLADESLLRQSPPPAASVAVKATIGQRIQPLRPQGPPVQPGGPP